MIYRSLLFLLALNSFGTRLLCHHLQKRAFCRKNKREEELKEKYFHKHFLPARQNHPFPTCSFYLSTSFSLEDYEALILSGGISAGHGGSKANLGSSLTLLIRFFCNFKYFRSCQLKEQTGKVIESVRWWRLIGTIPQSRVVVAGGIGTYH